MCKTWWETCGSMASTRTAMLPKSPFCKELVIQGSSCRSAKPPVFTVGSEYLWKLCDSISLSQLKKFTNLLQKGCMNRNGFDITSESARGKSFVCSAALIFESARQGVASKL